MFSTFKNMFFYEHKILVLFYCRLLFSNYENALTKEKEIILGYHFDSFLTSLNTSSHSVSHQHSQMLSTPIKKAFTLIDFLIHL